MKILESTLRYIAYRRGEADLTDCPYYRGTGTCGYGCRDEPSCYTDTPINGWPSERPKFWLLRARDKLISLTARWF